MIYDLSTYTYNGMIVPMEFWKPITQEMVPNVKPIYWISNIGNIYNSETGKYFNKIIIPGEYVNITLQTIYGEKVNALIHRLVCMAFNGMPISDNYQVDHINTDKTCNYDQNLEWVTPKENTNRAIENDLRKTCEDFYNSIFTNSEVIEICNMLMMHTPIDQICSIMQSKIYPRTYSNIKKIIFDILNKRTWKDITKNYNFPIYSNSTFTDEEVEIICKLLELEYTFDDILRNLGLYSDDINSNNKYKKIISYIKNGFNYTHISSKYNIQKGKKYLLTDDEINFICKSVVEGIKPKNIMNSMGERGKDHSVQQAIYNISAGLIHKKKLKYYKDLLIEGSTTIPDGSTLK